MSRTKRPGRGWAYACAQLGGVASVAANVAHSWVPPATAGPDWQPPTGAVIASVFWPVALLFAIEAFARVAWPRGWRYALLRFCGLLPVALVAAVVSYLHLSGLLASYGAGWFEVHIGPLAVDGLMVIGTSALIATSPSRRGQTPDRPGLFATLSADDRDLFDLSDAPQSPPPAGAHDARDPWQWATPAKAEQITEQAREQDEQADPDNTPTDPDNTPTEERPRPDYELLDQFGEQLRVLCGSGKLTRYRVEKVTGASARQAERLMEQITASAEQVGGHKTPRRE